MVIVWVPLRDLDGGIWMVMRMFSDHHDLHIACGYGSGRGRSSPYRDCDRVDDHLWRFQMLDCWGSKMVIVVAFAVAFIAFIICCTKKY